MGDYTGPEFALGTIRGYRQWLFEPDTNLLSATAFKALWYDGENIAKCRLSDQARAANHYPSEPQWPTKPGRFSLVCPEPPAALKGPGRPPRLNFDAINWNNVYGDETFEVDLSQFDQWIENPAQATYLDQLAVYKNALREYEKSIVDYNDQVNSYPERMKIWSTMKDGTDHVPVGTCRCGYYAISNPNDIEFKLNVYHDYIRGVIEGYGKVLLGTKGFRCEKAKLLQQLNPC